MFEYTLSSYQTRNVSDTHTRTHAHTHTHTHAWTRICRRHMFIHTYWFWDTIAYSSYALCVQACILAFKAITTIFTKLVTLWVGMMMVVSMTIMSMVSVVDGKGKGWSKNILMSRNTFPKRLHVSPAKARISLHIHTQSDQSPSSQGTLLVSMDPKCLQSNNDDSDQPARINLRWAHIRVASCRKWCAPV